MLIGDSIRLNYQSVVEEELSGEYNVWALKENCRFAKYTLNELQRYKVVLSQEESEKIDEAKLTPTIDKTENIIYPDIIHWNNGLWDTGIAYEEDGPFISIDGYIRDMSKILRELRKMTDKIHLSEKGKEVCGKVVAEFIRKIDD